MLFPKLPVISKGKAATSGYYQVGSEIFNNKLEALYYASNNKQRPRWVFHDDVYGKFDWTTRPLLSLKEVYRARAQQLRDKYDYISISFSGGADSWNTLNSFLSNGIHVDEVYTRFAIDGSRKYVNANSIVKNAGNYTSEYEYAVKPVLDYVAKNFPKTKITVDDITTDYFNEITEDEMFRTGHFAFSGMSAKRCANQIGLDVDYTNKKVASIRGSGKLQVFAFAGNFFTCFIDSDAWPVDSDPHLALEYFYWSPDMPEVVSVQAHTMLDYFRVRPELHNLIAPGLNTTSSLVNSGNLLRTQDEILTQAYDELVKSICYPGWDPNTFQAGKNSKIIFEREEDFWILKENSTSVQSWKWAVDQFYTKLDDLAFFNPDPADKTKRALRTFISKSYRIGSI
jgi:hypothetical protein